MNADVLADDVAPWVYDLRAAARLNLRDHRVVRASPRDVAAAFYGRLRYGFAGASHHIASAAVCRARGYAACADAVAAIVAAAVAQGLTAYVCVEAPDDVVGYSHVRALVEDDAGRADVIEAYPQGRPFGLAPSCEWLIAGSELLGAGRITLRRSRVVA